MRPDLMVAVFSAETIRSGRVRGGGALELGERPCDEHGERPR